jgi:hypothetical protein
MRTLIRRYKKNRRKAKHVKFLENRIAFLHNEIVSASFKGEFQFNKGITVIYSNVENKAKLLKKYNRRLKILIY